MCVCVCVWSVRFCWLTFVVSLHAPSFLIFLYRLHPFPFGGSKTSADALAAGLPLVCLEGQSLRGRMAYSFFVTMNMYDTVAKTSEEYENIAVRLGQDKNYRTLISNLVKEKSPVIWERMSVVDAWANFLQKAHRLAFMTGSK